MKPLKIAQISDFHFTEMTFNPLRLFSKRLLGLINWLFFRRKSFTRDSVHALPSLLKTLAPDIILLGGDFTSTALPKEFEIAKEFVRSLPTPWIAIPGNHDNYTYRSHRNKRFYHALSHKKPPITKKTDFFNLIDHGVEATQMRDHWWVISLDTSIATNPYSSRGLFSPSTEEKLLELLSLLPKEDSILLLNHYPFFHNDVPRHSLNRAESLEAILRNDTRIKAYLQGHSHRNTIADLQPSGLPVILDGGCVAKKENGSFNFLTLDNHSIRVDLYRYNESWKIEKTIEIVWTR